MRKKSIIAAFALATALPFAAPAMAQDYGLHAGGLEVPINKSQVVTSDRAISRAMVGNAEIADVLPISDRSIYVLGKASGTTSLTLYDRSNQVIAVMDVTVGPDVDGIRSELSALLPGEDVTARLSAGSVILSGFVSDAGAASRAAWGARVGHLCALCGCAGVTGAAVAVVCGVAVVVVVVAGAVAAAVAAAPPCRVVGRRRAALGEL